jgi:hypothetical protein
MAVFVMLSQVFTRLVGTPQAHDIHYYCNENTIQEIMYELLLMNTRAVAHSDAAQLRMTFSITRI